MSSWQRKALKADFLRGLKRSQRSWEIMPLAYLRRYLKWLSQVTKLCFASAKRSMIGLHKLLTSSQTARTKFPWADLLARNCTSTRDTFVKQFLLSPCAGSILAGQESGVKTSEGWSQGENTSLQVLWSLQFWLHDSCLTFPSSTLMDLWGNATTTCHELMSWWPQESISLNRKVKVPNLPEAKSRDPEVRRFFCFAKCPRFKRRKV